VSNVASIARKDQVDSFIMMQCVESTIVWHRKIQSAKIQSDRATTVNQKPDNPHRGSKLLQVAPLNIEDWRASGFSSKNILPAATRRT
jgi:hypothetical protein